MMSRSTAFDSSDPTSTDTRSIAASTSPPTRWFSVRAVILAIGLLLASALATGTATAGPLVPAFEVGAPGGGGGAATQSVELADSAIPGIRVE